MSNITESQIVAAARALADHNADVCNVNREDNWMIYGDSFRESAEIALRAAAGTTADAAAIAERPVYVFLVPGDVIQATDERYSAEYCKWKPIAPLYVGSPVEASTRPVRRALPARAALATTEATDAIAPAECEKCGAPSRCTMPNCPLTDAIAPREVQSVIAEMIAVATEPDEESEWSVDDRAQIDKWQARIAAALSAPSPKPAVDAPTDEQWEDLQEAREILENMVRSIELDGNYSTEATCTFLRQALQCLPVAVPAVDALTTGAVAEVVNKYGDPDAFAERDLVIQEEVLKTLPIGTLLYAAHPASEPQSDALTTGAVYQQCVDPIGGRWVDVSLEIYNTLGCNNRVLYDNPSSEPKGLTVTDEQRKAITYVTMYCSVPQHLKRALYALLADRELEQS